MKILISDSLSADGVQFLEDQGCFEVVNKPGLSPEDLLTEIKDADALIVRSKTKVTPTVFEAAEKLKVVGRAGAGVDNINLDAATRKGVIVMNTPGGNSISAGEHAFALLIALARKIPFAHASLSSGTWNKSAFMGQELDGKTLGIVGIGKIGSVLASRSAGFKMKVLAYDPFVTEAYAEDLGVQLATLDEIFKNSDFISLHLPANENTKHIINRETIAKMKNGAILINAARGALINEDDLIEALESGKLGGAGLDVFENEPNVSEKLRQTRNVVLTPHIAGSTVEAQAKVGVDIAKQIGIYLKEKTIVNAVNFPSVTPTEQSHLEPYIRLGEKLGSFIGQVSKLRVSEIGIRYYGELTKVNHKPLTNYILKSILKPMLSEAVNPVNARDMAAERGISVLETTSSRGRSYSNLISIQLRSGSDTEWIEGAILHKGANRLVSIDGIPAETQLGDHILFVRNEDTPGVVGHLGTLLGEGGINIGSFVLGRTETADHAVGIVNCDSPIPKEILEQAKKIRGVRFVSVVDLSS